MSDFRFIMFINKVENSLRFYFLFFDVNSINNGHPIEYNNFSDIDLRTFVDTFRTLVTFFLLQFE